MRGRVVRTGILAVLAIVASAASGASGPARAVDDGPSPDGAAGFAVGVRAATLVDPARPTPEVTRLGIPAASNRTIPVTAWYPARDGSPTADPLPDASPRTGRRYPLIVWAHGNGARGANAPTVVRDWARRGFVVVAPDFPVSSRARSNTDAIDDWANQPGDLRFVIDAILEGDALWDVGRLVDPERIGIAGHSLGAITVLAAAYGPDPDERIDAVVSLAGMPLLAGTDVGSRETPLLLVHGDRDPTIPSVLSRQMLERAVGPRLLVRFPEGRHSDYLQAPDPETATALATATLAFWDTFLNADPRAAARIPAVAAPGRVAVEAVGSTTTAGAVPGHPGACPRRGAPALDLRYARAENVDPHLLSLDVYPPRRGCPAPVVVWVHGGGFRVGDKRDQILRKRRLFARLGYVLVSVNYRLTDTSGPDPVQYPTHAADVASALAWVEQHIARYGGDPARIALLGHSAGAQIVATVATDERLLGAHRLTLEAIDCVAPLDTEGFDITRLAENRVRMYLEAFGSDPQTWHDASPIEHVRAGAGIAPHFLVRRGTPARQTVLARYETALAQAGVPFIRVDATMLTHGQVSTRIGAPGDRTMTPALATFLAGCFAGDHPDRP